MGTSQDHQHGVIYEIRPCLSKLVCLILPLCPRLKPFDCVNKCCSDLRTAILNLQGAELTGHVSEGLDRPVFPCSSSEELCSRYWASVWVFASLQPSDILITSTAATAAVQPLAVSL